MWECVFRVGLMGGHSGLNIHEGRGNAVQLAARVVDRILHTIPAARLASICGGEGISV